VASNLVHGDNNRCFPYTSCLDVFVYDRQTGTTEIASVNSQGKEGNDHSQAPALSADGRFVAFTSNATNLSNQAPAGGVFVRDRQTGTTEAVSVNSSGQSGNSSSYNAAISADGRFVAFQSLASNLVPNDNNGTFDIFVRDRTVGTTERVSITSAGVEANNESSIPDISADGRYVAFASYATNLSAGDTNGESDVFIHDRQTGITERMSVSSTGTPSDFGSGSPAISGDGQFLAFSSNATNLIPNDMNGWTPDVYLRDRLSGTTQLVSVSSSGTQASGYSWLPSISSDGRFIAFEASATLVAGDTNGVPDIYVRDRSLGRTARVSVANAGSEANNTSSFTSFSGAARISGNGRFVSFQSYASNLVAGDTNNASDIFVRDLGDNDNDGAWDPFDLDDDNDGFSDTVESYVGTNPLVRCGVDAWPADINNDGFSDISDISALTSVFGQGVPPAPARYNIAPDPPDGFVDITDVSRMTALFGIRCSP